VRVDAVGRYRQDPGPHTFPFFADDEFYEMPAAENATVEQPA